jgi:peptidyl-prolyl cis-trans isomerase B (cyclophilin B)
MAGLWQKLRGGASSAAVPPAGDPAQEVALLETTAGTMVVAFWPDVAPGTVANFKKLAREGFYNGTCFHRVVRGFMIQGGDPLTKHIGHERLWGTGDPGYAIKAEFNDRAHERGVISMARSEDPDSAGSQFFLCLDAAPFLDGQYTAFGRLIRGEDVLRAIGETPVTNSPDGERSRPVTRIGLERVRLTSRSEFP